MRTHTLAQTIFALGVLALCMSFFACTNRTAEKNLTLVMAEANPADSVSVWVDEAFKEQVALLSHGTITIDLQIGGILGDDVTAIEKLMQPHSEIQLARISTALLTAYGCEKSSLLTVPFTFADHNHFWNFAHSPVAEEILFEPYEKNIGVRGLFFIEEGFRHFFGTSRLASIDDFKGAKIRVNDEPIMTGVVRSLQGEPVFVNYTHLYAAFQTGEMEIAEQPIANYLANHFNKIAPYMILDGHTLGVTEVLISAATWDSLSKKQQQILIEAGKYAQEYCSKVLQEAENKARLTLRTEGTEFVTVDNMAEWKQACADVIAEASKANPKLYREILKRE